MDGVKESFLRRLEQIWTPEKLHKFVSEQVNWMYEDLQSPGEMKKSFLSIFHDELSIIADAMVGPFDEYRRIIERSANPILLVRPIKREDMCMPGKIMKLPEECEVEWLNQQEQFEKMINWPEHEELTQEMARITQEIYENAKTEHKTDDGPAGRVD